MSKTFKYENHKSHTNYLKGISNASRRASERALLRKAAKLLEVEETGEMVFPTKPHHTTDVKSWE